MAAKRGKVCRVCWTPIHDDMRWYGCPVCRALRAGPSDCRTIFHFKDGTSQSGLPWLTSGQVAAARRETIKRGDWPEGAVCPGE